MASNQTHDGGCTCRHVRYRMTSKPLFVHCCHCRWCQRETGSAFVLNAMIEADRVELLAGEPEMVLTPSASGKGQKIWRCPKGAVAGVVGIEVGVVSGVFNLESSGVEAPDRRPRHEERYHEVRFSKVGS